MEQNELGVTTWFVFMMTRKEIMIAITFEGERLLPFFPDNLLHILVIIL
jgi:hypothetical protein